MYVCIFLIFYESLLYSMFHYKEAIIHASLCLIIENELYTCLVIYLH
jgi:hypothetical protein